MSRTGLAFDPLLPLWALGVLSALVLLTAILRWRTPLGALLRLLAGFAAIGFLAGPELRRTDGDPLTDVAVVLTDASDSTRLGGREALTEEARARLLARLGEEGVEVREGRLSGTAETALGPALTEALGSVPRGRLSAVFVLTDGQVRDVPEPGALGPDLPLHVLLAGDPDLQHDRRVEVVRAPRYGVVGEQVEMTFRVLDEQADGPIGVRLSSGGEERLRAQVQPGETVTLGVPLPDPGEVVVEIEADAAPGELTERNNRAAARLTAVRDRLRVLLVSGEPHAGERVWRNILKSDPAVDLVHFTILKPLDKMAMAAEEDLNLIQFPHEELFLDKLPEFDVLIFDRYTYRGVLRPYEFERIAAYVEAGGAMLIAAGPELATGGSLAEQRSLAQVLPVLPAGRADERPFLPALTAEGRRHPVTAGLDDEPWGRWLRVLPGELREGTAVLNAPGGRPLLVLDRVGEGRVAMLMSDHVWLWARGFDGGGPHRELLRRLVHWLMGEPALDEEALSARLTAEGELVVTRRTLGATAPPAEVERPDGTRADLPLTPAGDGLFEGRMPAEGEGLFRVRADGPGPEPLFAVAALGEAVPRELREVLTTDAFLAPLAKATGGGVAVLPRGDALPDLRRVRAGARSSGEGWMGLPRRNAEAVRSVAASPLLPRWAWLVLSLGGIVLAWLAEGRRVRALSTPSPRSA